MTCVSGGIAAKGLAFGHGFELYLERATIVYDAGTYAGQWVVNRPLTLITDDGKAEPPELTGDTEWCSAFTAELQAAVNSLGFLPTVWFHPRTLCFRISECRQVSFHGRRTVRKSRSRARARGALRSTRSGPMGARNAGSSGMPAGPPGLLTVATWHSWMAFPVRGAD